MHCEPFLQERRRARAIWRCEKMDALMTNLKQSGAFISRRVLGEMYFNYALHLGSRPMNAGSIGIEVGADGLNSEDGWWPFLRTILLDRIPQEAPQHRIEINRASVSSIHRQWL